MMNRQVLRGERTQFSTSFYVKDLWLPRQLKAGVEDMALWVKGLLPDTRTCVQISCNHVKSHKWRCVCITQELRTGREQDRWLPEAHWLMSLVESISSVRDCLKN